MQLIEPKKQKNPKYKKHYRRKEMHKLKGEIQKVNKCMLVNLQYIFAGFLHGLKENLSGSDLRF